MTDPTSVTRRSFVGRAGLAAAAGPYIVSARALGREGRAAASDRLTLGFIGMGKQSQGHLRKFLDQADAQVVAVCDVDTTRREDARAKVEKKYGDGRRS